MTQHPDSFPSPTDVIIVLWGALVTLLVVVYGSGEARTRPYWHYTPATYLEAWAEGQHVAHPHVCVSGLVTLAKTEADGDRHVRLSEPGHPEQFIVAEVIPTLRGVKGTEPKLGQMATACGISRYDYEHGWPEVHAVEEWQH